MRQLSESVLKIVQRLGALKAKRTWFRRPKRDNETQALLQQLADAGETSVLPCCLPFLLSTSAEVRACARKTASILVRAMDPKDTGQLGDYLWDWDHWHFPSAWSKLLPANVGFVAGPQDEESFVWVLGLLSFHPSGYVRQEAVGRLGTIHDGSELPFLVLRQNDWVEPIARQAQGLVSARLIGANAAAIARCLGVFVHIEKQGRFAHRAIVECAIDLLLRAEQADLFRVALQSTDREVRRRLVRRGLEKDGEHRTRVAFAGVRSLDPIVRLECCRYLAQIPEHEQTGSALNRLVGDPFPPVRREALRALAKGPDESAVAARQRALFDRNRSVRALARYLMADAGKGDVTSLYRSELARSPNDRVTLEGMAETADKTDLPTLKRYLRHPFPSRRKAAIDGLARTGSESDFGALVPLIDDESPRVVRAARRVLARRNSSVCPEELSRIAVTSGRTHARAAAVLLLAEMGKWSSLGRLLEVVMEAPADAAHSAKREIEKWLTPPKWNKVFVSPSKADRQAIETALQRAGTRIPENLRAIIEAALTRC